MSALVHNHGEHGVFEANEAFARRIDSRVRERLAESVDLVIQGLAGQMPLERSILELGTRIRAGDAQACTFARYFEMLPAVLADDAARTRSAMGALSRTVAAGSAPFVTDWGRLEEDRQALLLARLNADDSTRVMVRAPAPESVALATKAIEEALAVFDRAAPNISGEIRALVRQIVLVSGTINGGDLFDGATCFATWGALFLNADEHATRIEAIDGLSHECAHAFLFGQSLGEPFVENDDAERHASPLRPDPRPLDGIFHATFVSARMHAANDGVLRSGLLGAGERAIAAERCAASLRAFADGRATLQRHARPTALGKSLLEAADAYMKPFLAEAAPLPPAGFAALGA